MVFLRERRSANLVFTRLISNALLTGTALETEIVQPAYMRQILLYLLSFTSCFAVARAEKTLKDTSNGNISATRDLSVAAGKLAKGCVKLKFTSHIEAEENKDSALIIFDRYNRTGADIIFDVFVQDKDHSITIPAVPAGKYFVTIQCMGLHHDRVEKVITVRAKKGKSLTLQLEDSEQFSKDKVVIPAYRPDPMGFASARTH